MVDVPTVWHGPPSPAPRRPATRPDGPDDVRPVEGLVRPEDGDGGLVPFLPGCGGCVYRLGRVDLRTLMDSGLKSSLTKIRTKI